MSLILIEAFFMGLGGTVLGILFSYGPRAHPCGDARFSAAGDCVRLVADCGRDRDRARLLGALYPGHDCDPAGPDRGTGV